MARADLKITLPMTRETALSLRAGDAVTLSGTLYAARDAAHKRFIELLDAGEPLPFDPRGAVIYYCGPTPAPPGAVIGSAGPTTSARMDAYAPRLLRLGVSGMIGKGARAPSVTEAIRETGAVYFAALGGAGALLAAAITASEVVAFPELGAEAVYRLTVADFPAVVATDASGASVYDEGRRRYLASLGAE
ncbi:MAG: Fe-S-containing hydro-lyase [Oscillospiraceae bacterium]|jgi:fumarate hydratase subunit beta|nr:Fe-S-containing hydro-lyase [Oscillospiraceae bacterium]